MMKHIRYKHTGVNMNKLGLKPAPVLKTYHEVIHSAEFTGGLCICRVYYPAPADPSKYAVEERSFKAPVGEKDLDRAEATIADLYEKIGEA